MKFFRLVEYGNVQVCINKSTDPSGILTCFIMAVFGARNTLFKGSCKFSDEAEQDKYFNDFGTAGAAKNDCELFVTGITEMCKDMALVGRITRPGNNIDIRGLAEKTSPALARKIGKERKN